MMKIVYLCRRNVFMLNYRCHTMKGRMSYLECFPTTINEYCEYTWQNGEYGTMILEVSKDDLSVDEYFFGYANMEGEEGERNKRIWQERANKKMHLICSGRPILFGIAAYWILHNKGISNTNLYENYLRDKIYAYKRKREQEVSSRKRNIELDFYANYIVPKEIEKNRMSKEIFDYITPQETKQLIEIMGDFIDYLKEKRTKMGYVENPQLKVLHYLDSGDKSVLEDMPDYEFNTICDELEKGGYIKVAWVEGHVPEDVKLLDKGRFYMEQLEKEGVAKKMQRSEDYKPTYINEQHNNNCQQFFYPISNCTFMMSPASPSAKQKPKVAKPKAKPERKPCGKPMTLKYYKHGNKGVLKKQQQRVNILFRKFTEWKWIDDQTAANDFDAFFEGNPRYCNITWTASSTILTILLQELLKQTYIERQTGCAAKSLVKQQFGKTANSDSKRIDKTSEDRIKLTLLILDINNPLPEPRGSNTAEDIDIQDAALQEIFAGQLRSTKGI